jgi:hypothetical protein
VNVGEALGRNGSEVGPSIQRQLSEYAVEVDRAWSYQSMGEKVQAQVGVGGIDRRFGQILDDRPDGYRSHTAKLVALGGSIQVGYIDEFGSERGLGIPDV